MPLSFSVTLDPPVFPSAPEVKSQIKKALGVFNTYYRRRVAQRFAAQGPGWAPRAEDANSTGASLSREKQAHALAAHKVKVKLLKQLRRSQRQFQKGKGTLGSVARRARVVEEFKRQIAQEVATLLSDKSPRSLTNAQKLLIQQAGDESAFFTTDKRLQKSVSGLRDRMSRAEQQVAQRLLGRIASAMKSRVQGMVLTVSNSVPFSGVQNDGGTVGHGAQLPARPFNYLDAMDVEVFAEIVANMMLVASA